MTARIDRHMSLVEKKYGLTADQLRAYAESAAFCMATAPGLGLSPAREDLARAMAQDGCPGPGLAADALDALVLDKVARDTDQLAGSGGPVFTFTHRRVQEYFATCVVLRRHRTVSPETLLTDGRWRETAVTILQTQPPAATRPLLTAAAGQLQAGLAGHAPGSRFTWPDGTLHALGILAQGGASSGRISPPVRQLAGELVGCAWADGRIEEKASALGIVQCADDATTGQILDLAFQSDSALLRERAFQRLAGLHHLPESVDLAVRRILVEQWASSQLWRQRTAIRVQLRRLPRPALPLIASTVLPFMLPGDILLLAAAADVTATAPRAAWSPWWLAFILLGLAHFGLRMQQDGIADSFAVLARRAPAMRLIRRILPSGQSRQLGGEIIRAVASLPIAVSLLRLNSQDIGAIITVAAAVAWPDLCLHYLRTGRRKRLRHWWKHIDWRFWQEIDWLRVGLLAGVMGAPLPLVVFLHIPESKPPPSNENIDFHLTGMEAAVLIGIGITIGAAVLFFLFLAARRAVGVYRESRASAIALKEIVNRIIPYEADDVVTALQSLDSQYALKAFLWTLRARPMLCMPGALSVLSDLACAAREKPSRTSVPRDMTRSRKGSRASTRKPSQTFVPRGMAPSRASTREKPPQASVPRGSSPQYAAWARNKDHASLHRVLQWLDRGAIDDIVLLTEQVRALDQT